MYTCALEIYSKFSFSNGIIGKDLVVNEQLCVLTEGKSFEQLLQLKLISLLNRKFQLINDFIIKQFLVYILLIRVPNIFNICKK